MQMLLGDRWVDRTRTIEVRDPDDDSLIDTVPAADAADVDQALAAAVQGAAVARRSTALARATVLRQTAHLLASGGEAFAQLLARESSKTIREARREVARCVNTLELSASHAGLLAGETIPFDAASGGEGRRGWFERCPVGIVVAITPFNDPLNLVAHKLGPAIAAGNAVVLKPASATPLSALKLAELLLEAGLPPLVLQVLTGRPADVGEALVSDDRVRMVSFTGGVEAGRRIARAAALKKISMELGSNSPVIVWSDADLEVAVQRCVSGSFWAAGQNCIGVQRIYIHVDIYETFRDAFVARTRGLRLGPKLDEATDMGPVINEASACRLQDWIGAAVAGGARVLSGGGRQGTHMPPTVLEGVPLSARLHREEAFGPTVNLYPVQHLDEAIRAANDVRYGLHAAIFTRDSDVAFAAIDGFDCGGVMINDSTDYRFDGMPFGGVKDSGVGREGILFAVEEMTETKVVCWNTGR